ncbi:MAG TPA: fumarylacetoacetate hydrolase family protein, partial [Bacteroidota bacterium]
MCLGRNYEAHAHEMKTEVPRIPVVFLKPSTALLGNGSSVVIPSFSRDVHHEVELVVMIARGGKNIPRSQAYDHVGGYAVGLDMTMRDVQAEAKAKGLPWTVAKGFDTSAPVSPFVHREAVPDPHNLLMTLAVNGKIRQLANTGSMLFRIDHVIEYLSTVFTLEEGDLIFTGTPEGVGAVETGDRMHAELESVGTLDI